MMEILRPALEWELAGTLAQFSSAGRTIEVIGGGSKRACGRPASSEILISLANLRGVPRFDPDDRVVTASAGTLIYDLERELARHGLMLAFEPVDLGPLLGEPAGGSTVGGMIATDIAGSRRCAHGRCVDHLRGATIVTGSGSTLTFGSKSGLAPRRPDWLLAIAGAWGSFAIATELVFEAVPMPQETATIGLRDLPHAIAVQAMQDALKCQCGVTGAVHIEALLARRMAAREFDTLDGPITLLRIESPSQLLPGRVARLRERLAAYSETGVLADEESIGIWSELQRLSPLCGSERPVWRLILPPGRGEAVLRDIRRYFPADAMTDWAGATIWLEVPFSADAGAADIRRVLANHGGHATLIRAAAEVRAVVDPFPPPEIGTERMLADLKRLFDPNRVLNPGRLHAGL